MEEILELSINTGKALNLIMQALNDVKKKIEDETGHTKFVMDNVSTCFSEVVGLSNNTNYKIGKISKRLVSTKKPKPAKKKARKK